MHLLSIWATTQWKMLINNKFNAQTLTGSPTGNYHCPLLVSHALNMSCSFSQSVHSIESRCVVSYMALLGHIDNNVCNLMKSCFSRKLDNADIYHTHCFISIQSNSIIYMLNFTENALLYWYHGLVFGEFNIWSMLCHYKCLAVYRKIVLLLNGLWWDHTIEIL